MAGSGTVLSAGGNIEHTPIVDFHPGPDFQPAVADADIRTKWESMGGSPGPAVVDGFDGLIDVAGGVRKDFANGSIYRKTGAAGMPCFFVQNATDQRYDQLGGPNGFLKFPKADSVADPNDPASLVTQFEGGSIYFWPDVGAIEMQDVFVRYVGFHCFGESNEITSASDEVYFTFGTVPTLTDLRSVAQTRIFNDVDAGESIAAFTPVVVYQGPAMGAAISVTLVEHDEGDPDKYKGLVKKGVDKASDAAIALVGDVPVFGPFLSLLATFILEVAKPEIVEKVNEALGTDDDVLGTKVLALTPKDMLRLTRVGQTNFEGIQAHLETELFNGDGSSYKVYFDIVTVL